LGNYFNHQYFQEDCFMKRFILTIAGAIAFSAIASFGQTAPNLSDAVLVAYQVPTADADFTSAGATAISSFWGTWDGANASTLGMDIIKMDAGMSAYAQNRCAASAFTGAEDAGIEIRAAYSATAVYLYCAATDNSFVDYVGWQNDVVDIYVDAMNKANGLADAMNYFNPQQWGLTLTSKQIQVGMGGTSLPSVFNYRFYDNLAMTFTDHAESFGDASISGMTMKIVSSGSGKKIQEWYIPFTEFGITETAEGTRYGFTGGYNDNDNGDAVDCTNSLRWQGLCDPYCAATADTWGELELGPTTSAVKMPLKASITRSIAKSTNFYTIRGEKVSGSTRTAGLVVRHQVLNSGIVKNGLVR
jgi:hypothetical protein